MSRRQPRKFWKKGYVETELKHAVLEKYLPAFWKILGGKAPGFIYVDGFAGRGCFDDGSKGSPLLAMELVADLQRKGALKAPVSFAFIEADRDNCLALQHAARSLAKELKLGLPIIKCGTFQEHISDVLKELERRCKPKACPTFIFIDPFGYKDIPMRLISELGKARHRELFITFMSQHMARFLSDGSKSEALNSVFGNSAWLHCFFEKEPNQNCLVRVYAEELSHRLQRHLDTFVFPFRVETTKEGGLYHLIHVSHHPKARLEIDRAVKAAGATKRDAAVKEVKEKGLGLKLPDSKPVPTAEEAILNFLAERLNDAIPVLDVAAALWRREEFMDVRWRDFEATVISLSKKGFVLIERPENQPKRRSVTHLYPEKGETLRLPDPLTE